MKIAHLDWHTSLPSAVADATKHRRPILSLRLLGRLDEEYSCANSRYFRTLLYPEKPVRNAMRAFTLHWQSLRPVPKVTIDFGGGRTLVRTITGNSLHAVLRSDGTPVDAVLGLMTPDVFVQALRRSLPMASATTISALSDRHREALANPPTLPPVQAAPDRIVDASKLARTKHMVESPLITQLRRLKETLAQDTQTNELDLHPKLHRAFLSGAPWKTADEMVDWIYSELFLMPPDDPFLGLSAPDAFSALPS